MGFILKSNVLRVSQGVHSTDDGKSKAKLPKGVSPFQRGHISREECAKSSAFMRGFLLVITAGTGRRAAELGAARSAQCGRAVWIAVRIAVVRMQPDHADIPVMGLGLMTTRLCKCDRAGERERRG